LGDIGIPELLIMLLLVVVLFGSRRLPEAGRSLGEGMRNFKTGLHGSSRAEIDDADRSTEN
jgi:sec-independent protein translocase protein TatA